MADLLTVEEDAEAAKAGWELRHVYDLDTSRWRIMVLAEPHAEFGAQLVIDQARAGSRVAQKALQLLMTQAAVQPKRKKK